MSPARFPNGLEVRTAAELRSVAGSRRLEGYAAVFGSPATIADFSETIRAGAFRASLEAGADILALVDHDHGKLLARTSSGTLRLKEDAYGLAFSLDLPDTQLGRDILALAERRDLGGMSFGFRVQEDAWPARNRRELRAVDLVEVSVVQAFPAYAATSVAARARISPEAEARMRRLLVEAL
jgi:uncharacterized protein